MVFTDRRNSSYRQPLQQSGGVFAHIVGARIEITADSLTFDMIAKTYSRSENLISAAVSGSKANARNISQQYLNFARTFWFLDGTRNLHSRVV